MTQTDTTLEQKPPAAAPLRPSKRSIPQLIFDFLSSLRLTVVFLTLAVLLVFFGTIAQVEQGLYDAQHRFFRSLIVWWSPGGADWKLPVFPGGYLVGGVLLLNLVFAHFKRFQFSSKKIGISLIHAGIVLLLLGQFATDMLQVESAMRLQEGEIKNYSESSRDNELVVIDANPEQHDNIVSIPQRLLERNKEVTHEDLPFTIRVKNFHINSQLLEARDGASPAATQGIGARVAVRPLPKVTDMERRDVPTAIVELFAGGTSLGTWLLSSYLEDVQPVTVDGKTYHLGLRFTRFYKPFHIELMKFTHERYQGTDIPKNYASRVRVIEPDGEPREVDIWMNNPLRIKAADEKKSGFLSRFLSTETYYQSGFDPDNDRLERKVTILQVVRNPGWLTPYFACVIVSLGLIWQFTAHLVGFVTKQRKA